MRRVNLFALEPSAPDDPAAAVGRAVGGEQIVATLRALPAGEASHPYHFHHDREEWALVVAGSPRVRTPGGERELRAGDVVCFPAGRDGAHELTGPGTVLLIAEDRGLDVVEYPERGEIAVFPAGKVFRTADGADAAERE